MCRTIKNNPNLELKTENSRNIDTYPSSHFEELQDKTLRDIREHIDIIETEQISVPY